MDEEQQIIQEPVQEPAPEKQSDKTQAILTVSYNHLTLPTGDLDSSRRGT